MLYCKKCGLKLDGKSVLCPRCGEYTYNSINDNSDNNKTKNTIYSNSNTNTNTNANTNPRSRTSSSNAKTNDDVRYDIFNPPKRNYEDYSIQRQQREDYNRQKQQNEDYKKPPRDRNPKEDNSGSWAKTFFKWFFIILLLISVTAFAAYFAYNKFMGSSTSEYIKSISSLNKSINDANNNMASVIKNDNNNNVLPTQDILSKIPEEKKSFDSIIKKFDDITVPSMYSSSHSNLEKAIRLNREIYVEIDKILANPIDPNAKQNLDHLTSQIDECMSDYASVSIGDIAFSLPDEILSISSKIEPWINQKQEKYKSAMDQVKLFSDYFDSMIKLFGRFNEAKVDFTQTIKNVRANQASWDDLFSQIDKSLNAKKAIKSDYKNLSVPSPVKSLNQKFMDILDESIAYDTKLRSAAEKESNFNKEGLTEDEIKTKQKEIEDAYKEAQELYSSSSAAYQKYASLISREKEKYADPEFAIGLGQGK